MIPSKPLKSWLPPAWETGAHILLIMCARAGPTQRARCSVQHKNTELLTLKRTTTVEYSACLCTLHTTLHALHTNSIGHCSLSAHTSKVLPLHRGARHTTTTAQGGNAYYYYCTGGQCILLLLHRGARQGEEADGYDLAGIDSSFHTLSTSYDNDDRCDVDSDDGCDDEFDDERGRENGEDGDTTEYNFTGIDIRFHSISTRLLTRIFIIHIGTRSLMINWSKEAWHGRYIIRGLLNHTRSSRYQIKHLPHPLLSRLENLWKN